VLNSNSLLKLPLLQTGLVYPLPSKNGTAGVRTPQVQLSSVILNAIVNILVTIMALVAHKVFANAAAILLASGAINACKDGETVELPVDIFVTSVPRVGSRKESATSNALMQRSVVGVEARGRAMRKGLVNVNLDMVEITARVVWKEMAFLIRELDTLDNAFIVIPSKPATAKECAM